MKFIRVQSVGAKNYLRSNYLITKGKTNTHHQERLGQTQTLAFESKALCTNLPLAILILSKPDLKSMTSLL